MSVYGNSAPVDDLVSDVASNPFYALTEAYNRGVNSTKISSLSAIEDCITKAVSDWFDNASYDEIKELIISPYLDCFYKKCNHRSISLFDLCDDKD